MSDFDDNLFIEQSKQIKEKIFAGRASLDLDQINQLIIDFNDYLGILIKENIFTGNERLINEWSIIFEALIPSDLSYEIADSLDTDEYFNFGEMIISLLGSKNNGINKLAHGYLDLFRSSEFLTKIYEDQKWPLLIEKIIVKSNFNFARLFEQRTKEYGNKTLFKLLDNGKEKNLDWDKIDREVARFRKSLIQNLVKGDLENGKAAFLLDNSLNMAILDLACLTTGIVNIMIPANSVSQHVSFILNQTKAELLFVSDEKQLAKLKTIKNNLPNLKKVVMLIGNSAEDWVISLKEFINEGIDINDEDILKQVEKIEINDLATIMYTSGTTGQPKGIMFSNLNIVYKRFCRAMALPEIGDKDRFLAYLPLFHTFGRYLEMTGAIFWGAEYIFMENPSAETMIENMKQVQPTIFISIPKKWMQLFEIISSRINLELDEKELIEKTVLDVTGGKLKWGLSAAGYLPPEIFQFFQSYNIELMSGFGMTEATGGITMTPPNKYFPNSLGKALPGIEIKVADDGELLIRGSYVMIGYFAQKAEEVFIDGNWFPTGDVMKMDNDGFIEIIDRKKEIYKNIKGETIAPQRIENLFRDFEFVKQVFLVGDHRPFNTVLIFPNYESENVTLAAWDSKQQYEYFSSVVVMVNKFLAPFERIIDFRLIESPFTESKGELTPKGTYKRRVIEKNYNDIIESMYTKDYTDIFVGDLEVRIPNWFLREQGALSRELIALPEGIYLPKNKNELVIKKYEDNNKVYRIGNFNYEITKNYIDLQPIIINPLYWLGNKNLLDFCGESIFQWYRQRESDDRIKFISVAELISSGMNYKELIEKMVKSSERSLYGVNIAVLLLQSTNYENNKLGSDFIKYLAEDETLPIYPLLIKLLSRPNISQLIEIARSLFENLVLKTKGDEFADYLYVYLQYHKNLLNESVIKFIIEYGYRENYKSFEKTLDRIIKETDNLDDLNSTAIPDLMDLLSEYGMQHPTKYEHIRQIFAAYQLDKTHPDLSELARSSRKTLRLGFRKWLGENQSVAVDIENGEEYTWKDVIIFDQDIDPEDKKVLTTAIKKSPILREAIFLFSGGKLIRLNDILPGGIWISILRTFNNKIVFRASVQTRFHGAFDISLTLNKSISHEAIIEEVNWMILAGSRYFIQELVEDFGGYWGDYNLWSGKYIPGDTVGKMLQREGKKETEKSKERFYHLWPFFIWNASASFFNFWRMTNYSLELQNPSIYKFIIPSHDYQTGTRVVTLSERVEYKNISELFFNFYDNFISAAEEEYPYLKRERLWNYIFSGLMHSEGEEKGKELLKKFKDEMTDGNTKSENSELIINSIDNYLNRIEEIGFMQKPLYFAIKRFHRWFKLNEDAAVKAQAEMLNELYETYRLHDLEKKYPETRTRFFLETAFAESSTQLKNILSDIVKKLHDKSINREDAMALVSNIQTEFTLNEKEKYFITRISYSHIKPTDSAELVHMHFDGNEAANLVVQYEDLDGQPFIIRNPVSPKEISRLHQLYIEANLLVHFKPEHHFLVAISDRGFIIGGLFYSAAREDSVHMEKIVVSNPYRRKGISDKLMNEFFNRMKNQNVGFVSTGFFRPEYFYRFGFKIEKKYSGLVKSLLE
ncbi:MAG: AMP-binding protein [Melioribacteraceae bacterium]|nr:AMP-binding protein [Melioribacteraceae bacterium]MCF8355543.1 AMP-binding protein [Melioribacteraceae bacterium]MCF8394502.1 AMP-binding protein [Melioribacteraceae bacterium]MCF8420118.1 AMP-binding protein [Melioribacteraceae bacterium]